MALADEDYYNNVYKGVKPDGDLSVLLERASDIVRQNCNYVIDDIEKLPSFMQENLKKAVCSQAEFMELSGGADAFISAGYSGFRIGDFSMSGGNFSGNDPVSKGISPNMISYLEAAGLLYRGGI